MLFTKTHTLAERIVEYLAYHPKAQLSEMQETINYRIEKKMTPKAWYKAINSLLTTEVIVKEHKRYSLNLSWAALVSQFSYFVDANYLSNKSDYFISFDEFAKKNMTYHFPNLLMADVFWTHLFTLLSAKYPRQPFYSYNPHFWYFVAHCYETERYYESTKPFGITSYVVVGSRSDIDLWSARLLPKTHKNYYCSPKPLTHSPEVYTSSMGDHLVTIKIGKDMAGCIDQTFRTTTFNPKTEEPPKELSGFFTQKSPCTLTIVKDAKKAGVFARKIRRYF